ncbi:MAG: GerMN domain-containing protein [Propionibacteriaceae bacterium]|mgnify:CR=1 FL=1|nr:GerMN domain-containing protein [Micropruina sp.]
MKGRFRLGLVLVVFLLVGCTGLPTRGPVETHTAVAPQGGGGVAIAPAAPAPGASPETIVEGFLHAMATYQAGYPVARQYLTAGAGGAWHPEAGITVYAEGHPPTVLGDNVVLVAPTVGSVTGSGIFSQASGQIRQDFGLVKNNDGEWRISNPPTGLLLSQYLFRSSFAAIRLYFYEPGMTYLIPDQRFVPNGPAGPARAVTELLSGPRPGLVPALAASSTRSIKADSVTEDPSGIVTVTLNDASLNGLVGTREQLVGQLAWTLDSFDSVSAFRVVTRSDPWLQRASDTSGRVELNAFPELTPIANLSVRDLWGVVAGKLVQLSPLAADRVSDPVAGLDGVAVGAAKADGRTLAAVTTGGALVVGQRDGKFQVEVANGMDKVRPQYSRLGELWSVTAGGFRVSVDGQERRLTTALPGPVRAFRVSPDGTTVAAVTEANGAPRLSLGLVVREGATMTITGWRPLEVSASTGPSALDVAWLDAVHVAALVKENNTTSVLVGDSDGAQFDDVGPNQVADLVEIASAPGGTSPTIIRSEPGLVYRYRQQFSWIATGQKFQSLFYA